MLEITHDREPALLMEFKSQHRGIIDSDTWKLYRDYESLHSADKPLARSLHALQEGLCIYCERPICAIPAERKQNELDRHVEHLRPRSLYPQESITYTNLALSCTASGRRSMLTCGNKKADKELPILPTEKHRHLFDLDIESGRMIPALDTTPAESAKVRNCIELLNLNQAELCHQRAQVFENLKAISANTELTQQQANALKSAYCHQCTEYGQEFAPTLRKVFAKLL